CLTPLLWLTGCGLGLSGWSLGPDPIKFTLHTLGKTAPNMLLIPLVATPGRQLAGWTHVVRIRRMLGLFAFFYTLLHFLIYLVLDQVLDYMSLLKDIVNRPLVRT